MSKKEDKYLNMADDFDNLRYGLDKTEKAIAGVKLFGKGVFNVSKFVFSAVIPEAADQMKKDIERKKSK